MRPTHRKVLRRLTLTVTLGSVCLVAASIALPRAQAQTSFVPGTATGTAQAFAVAPRTGGFAYTITGGSSVADFRGTLGQAESQSVDFGLIGTSLTTQQCDGSDPAVDRSRLPQPLIAESDKGDTHRSADMVGSGQQGLVAVGGHLTVSATTRPASTAGFDGGVLSIPGVLEATGLSSGASAALVPGTARLAGATAHVGRLTLGGGAVVLTDLQWTADQRSGTHPSRTGTFSVGSVLVAGQSLPASPEALASTFAAVNAALRPTGLTVTVPAAARTSDGGIDVPPLSVGIDGSQVGGAVLNPVLTAAQPATQALISAILGVSCKAGNAFTLADILLSAADGTGSLDLQFGGVTAGSEGHTYANPFGELGAGQPLTATSVVTAGRSSGAATPARSGSLPATSTGSPPAAGAAPQVATASESTSSCASTSPAHWPSCSNGAALAAGLVGLVAVGAVGGADWLIARRRRRLPVLDL